MRMSKVDEFNAFCRQLREGVWKKKRAEVVAMSADGLIKLGQRNMTALLTESSASEVTNFIETCREPELVGLALSSISNSERRDLIAALINKRSAELSSD